MVESLQGASDLDGGCQREGIINAYSRSELISDQAILQELNDYSTEGFDNSGQTETDRTFSEGMISVPGGNASNSQDDDFRQPYNAGDGEFIVFGDDSEINNHADRCVENDIEGSLPQSTSPKIDQKKLRYRDLLRELYFKDLSKSEVAALMVNGIMYTATRLDKLNNFFESYGGAFSGVYLSYYFCRLVGASFGAGPRSAAIASFLMGSVFELDQYLHPVVYNYGQEIVRTPDLGDIAAYAAAAALAYTLDKGKQSFDRVEKRPII